MPSFGITLFRKVRLTAGLADTAGQIIPRCLRISFATLACLSRAACFAVLGGSTGSVSLSRSRNLTRASMLVQFVPPTFQISRRTIRPLVLFRPAVAQRKRVAGWGVLRPRTDGSRLAACASDIASSLKNPETELLDMMPHRSQSSSTGLQSCRPHSTFTHGCARVITLANHDARVWRTAPVRLSVIACFPYQ